MQLLRTLKPPRFSKRGAVHVIPKITVATAILSITNLPFSGLALGISDITPPQLTWALVPVSGQTLSTNNQNTIELKMNVEDDLSGALTPDAVYNSASGQTLRLVCSGDTSDTRGNFSCIGSTPAYVASGSWTLSIKLTDQSGNVKNYSPSDLTQLGFSTSLQFTGPSDTQAPKLSSFKNVSTGPFDVTNGSINVTTEATISDNMTDLSSPFVTYVSPSGKQIATGYANIENGNKVVSNISFPQYSENGLWSPVYVLSDVTGNTRNFVNSDFQTIGYDGRIQITGTSDTAGPTLTSAQVGLANPIVENTSIGGAMVTVSAVIKDNLSGLSPDSELFYQSPSGTVNAESYTNIQSDGTVQFTANLPAYAASGVWKALLVLKDYAGNTTTLSSAQLAAQSSPIDVSVIKNNSAKLVAGGTITSDVEGDGATAQDPVEATVISPVAGDASIVTIALPNGTTASNGYNFFDRQISILAPTATVEAPLSIVFRIDSSKVPSGQNENTLQVTRNGATIAACTSATQATPDPCIYSRVKLSDGDIEVKVHSTSASVWSSGFSTTSKPTNAQIVKILKSLNIKSIKYILEQLKKYSR